MTLRGPLVFLPNLITLARLLAVPVAVYVILEGHYGAAFWIFIAAGISDAVDGVLAKRFNAVSEFGAYLDPLADKALLVGVYIALDQVDHIPTWLVFMVVFRDVLIIGGAILFQTLTQSLKMDPLYISKINTVAQIVLAGLVLAELGLGVPRTAASELLVYVVALTTFTSGAAYVYKWGWQAMMVKGDE